MGGCSVIIIFFFIIPIVLLVLALMLGLVGGGIIAGIASLIIFIILTKNGTFEKYKNSEVAWQRTSFAVLKVLLIIIMIGSVAAVVGGLWVLRMFQTSA